MADFLKKDKIFAYLIIILVSIFVCIPLANSKLDITYDDGIQHICRLMGTKQSIQEGQTFPVIMSNFCNGFGYSWNLFYSPLTAFGPLLLQWFGISFTTCLKWFMLLITMLTGLAMYQMVKEISKNNLVAILGAVLYILAPYRLTDMYIRYALAELVSFLFLPIIFLGMYRLFYRTKKKDYLLAVGTIGLLLTHTVIAFYTAIFCFIYVILHYKKIKKKKLIKPIVVNIVLAIIISSFLDSFIRNKTSYAI
ncbi:MAG: 6-pyruvoyl-tetrahydropterin synthase-related protein [Clostridia bacterium]